MLVYKTQKDAFGAVDVPDVRQDGWCHAKLNLPRPSASKPAPRQAA